MKKLFQSKEEKRRKKEEKRALERKRQMRSFAALAGIILVCLGIAAVSSFYPEEEAGTEIAAEEATEAVTEIAAEEATEPAEEAVTEIVAEEASEADLNEIPAYSGNPYVELNNNIPYFSEEDIANAGSSYEFYSEFDSAGRCGVCVASVGQDIMPEEERGNIGSVKPTGWHTVKYNGVIDGNYLYNRCHLLAYELTGENANEQNLITGTRYLNVEGMLPFENSVAEYVKSTGNHVLYRVTPVFEGDNLLASGVRIEAESVEDKGQGILFHVYCYNVQPGIAIDYATGDSGLDETAVQQAETFSDAEETAAWADDASGQQSQEELVWIPVTGSKYHNNPDCSNMKNPKQVTKEEAVAEGYEPCKKCYGFVLENKDSSFYYRASGRVKINSVPTPSVLITLIFSSCA